MEGNVQETPGIWDRLIVPLLLPAFLIAGIGMVVLAVTEFRAGTDNSVAGLKRRAQQGEFYAQYTLGYDYLNGTGVPRDGQLALHWFTVAANNSSASHSQAQSVLCFLYLNGSVGPKDPGQAKEWCEKAAAAGDASGEGQLGYIYLSGEGVPHDYDRAFALETQAAAQRNAVGERLLAYMYYKGLGTKQDPATAADWYEKSSTAGDHYSTFMLGHLYYRGEGRPKDVKRGIQLTRQAADAGVADAQMEMAAFYAHGEGMQHDPAQQKFWLQKALAQNYAPAGCVLAMLHFDHGDGSVTDQQAMQWMAMGGQDAEMWCMNNEAWSLATAAAPEQRDPVKAERWAKQALVFAPDRPQIMDTLAAAYAAEGKFDEAVALQQQAVAKLPATPDYVAESNDMKMRLGLYRSHRAYVSGE